jgi:Protein of unknown function (DUF2971)
MTMSIINYKIFKDKSLMEKPSVIYKYRKWNDLNHRTIITKKEVYLSSPRKFEDPLDCKIPIRYDLLSEKDIFDKYFDNSKLLNPNWSRQQHRKYAREWTKKSPLKDKQYLESSQKIFFEDLFNKFGVLSLTANYTSEYMWIKYADNYKGFCVGFNFEIMFKFLGGGGPVTYYDVLPTIYPEPKHSIDEQHILQLYSKLRKWEFEKEYRTDKFSLLPLTEKQRIIKLPSESYKELILGKEMSDNDKEDLLRSIPDDLKNIEIIEQK